MTEEEKPVCRHSECKTGARCFKYNLGHKCNSCLTCVKIDSKQQGREKALEEAIKICNKQWDDNIDFYGEDEPRLESAQDATQLIAQAIEIMKKTK